MVKDIKAVFAEAEHAEAEHHYLRAAEAYAKKQHKKAGHELHTAAVSLENGFTWAADEVTKAIEYLGKEIGKLEKAVAG